VARGELPLSKEQPAGGSEGTKISSPRCKNTELDVKAFAPKKCGKDPRTFPKKNQKTARKKSLSTIRGRPSQGKKIRGKRRKRGGGTKASRITVLTTRGESAERGKRKKGARSSTRGVVVKGERQGNVLGGTHAFRRLGSRR